MTQAYPLAWPEGWPRHRGWRQSGKFKAYARPDRGGSAAMATAINVARDLGLAAAAGV